MQLCVHTYCFKKNKFCYMNSCLFYVPMCRYCQLSKRFFEITIFILSHFIFMLKVASINTFNI